jgi:hypothetical protein
MKALIWLVSSMQKEPKQRMIYGYYSSRHWIRKRNLKSRCTPLIRITSETRNLKSLSMIKGQNERYLEVLRKVDFVNGF